MSEEEHPGPDGPENVQGSAVPSPSSAAIERDIVEVITVGSTPAPDDVDAGVLPPVDAAVDSVVDGDDDDDDDFVPRGKHAAKAVPQEDAGDAPAAGAPAAGAPDAGAPDAGGYVAAFTPIPKRRGRVLKALGIGVGVIAAVLAAVYVAGGVAFGDRFLPNTTINGVDVSLKTDEEAVQLIDNVVSSYQLDVMGGGFSYRATAQDLGLNIDAEGIVAAMHQDMDQWSWPLLLAEGAHDESYLFQTSYNAPQLASQLSERLVQYNQGATAPQNAYVTYDDAADAFVVKPEVAGTQFEPDLAYRAADAAVKSLSPKVQLSSEQLVAPEIVSTDTRLVNAANEANRMTAANLSLVLPGGAQLGAVNSDNLSPLVSIDDRYRVNFDEEGLTAWVDGYVNGYNTVGTERTYTRPDGKEVTIGGGSYGWEIDNEELSAAILDGVKAGATADIEVPCWSMAYKYDGPGLPDWGNRYIDVDLSEQHVRFYDSDASVIWESDCISGSPDGVHDTVTGVWYVNNKESPSKLIGYENGKKIYESYVTFWMPFEGNSIGLHDATWQPGFGGSMYANGYGSHGCVNLPYDKAQELYGLCEVDDPVIVHW